MPTRQERIEGGLYGLLIGDEVFDVGIQTRTALAESRAASRG